MIADRRDPIASKRHPGMDALSKPSRVGKYELLTEIGRGGMATVYRARLRVGGGVDKPVSLKLLHSHLAGERDFLLLFENEMRVAIGMSHRNIVQTFDAGEQQGRHFMVMELVEGCTLRQLLGQLTAAGERLPVELGLFVGMEVCAALDYAHRHPTGQGNVGVYHRDVSPSNILLSREGDVKLVDFGVARAAGRLTVVGDAIKGKLGYMAPEQARGEVDGRCDLFSLGATLYELLTGQEMRRTADLDAVIYHRVEELTPPSRHRDELPPGVDRVLLDCLARAPEDRPASAAALRDRLAELAFEVQRVVGGGFDLQMRLRDYLQQRLAGPVGPAPSDKSSQTARVRRAMLDQAREIPTDVGAIETPSPLEQVLTIEDDAITAADLPAAELTADGFTADGFTADGFTGDDEVTGIALVAFDGGRRRAWGLLAGGGLLLLALAVAIFIWVAGDSTPRGGLAVAVDRADIGPQAAALTRQTDASVATPRPDAASPRPDLAAVTTTVTPADSGPTPRRPRTRLRRPRRLRSKQVAKLGKGWLDINAAPWARVYVDGRYRGDTPLQNLALAAGKHTVKLVNPRLKASRTLTVRIRPGKHQRQAVRLGAP